MKKLFSKPYLKKTICVMLMCLAFLGLAIGLPLGLMPQEEDKRSYALNGSGSYDDPYTIWSADDWNEMAQMVNNGEAYGAVFMQMGTLQGSLMQVGTETNRFNGYYYGAGYEIYVDEVYTNTGKTFGLFGFTEEATIDNTVVYYTSDYSGGYIVNALESSWNEIAIGGLVCFAYGGDCINNYIYYGLGDFGLQSGLAGAMYFGGLIGISYGSISNCWIDGNFTTAIPGTTVYAGGVVGYSLQELTSDNNIYYTANISVRPDEAAEVYGMGIIAGRCDGESRNLSSTGYFYYEDSRGAQTEITDYIGEGEYIEVYEFSGAGTSSSPYLINTVEDLQGLANNVNSGISNYSGKYFKQTANLELGGMNWKPIGGETSQYYFAGIYDGNYFKINGMYIYSTTAWAQVALFGHVGDNGQVKNVYMENVNVTHTETENTAGGLVGLIGGSVKITNCHVSGKVKGLHRVGGLVSYVWGGTITDSSFTGTIESTTTYAGGLTGYAHQGKFSNCFVNAYVKGKERVGGFVGQSAGEGGSKLELCSFNGTVEGTSYVGGLTGYSANGTISKCTVNAIVTGSTYVGGFIGQGDSTSTATDCAVYGQVITTSSTLSSAYTGALLGDGTMPISNTFFIGGSTQAINLFNGSGTITNFSNCYSSMNNTKKYKGTDFSGFSITSTNYGYPIQNNLFSLALGGYTHTQIVNNLKSKGFTQA